MRSRHVTTVVLLATLATSIALNIVLYSMGRSYYLQLNEVRLDPLGLTYRPVGDEGSFQTPGAQPLIVFFGDSRVEHWPPLGTGGFAYVNRGISNQSTAQILSRFDSHVVPLEPEVILIQAGVNDLKAIPLFPDRREAIVAGCQTNIEQIVEKARDLDATVILTTIFPLGEVPLERRLFWSGEVEEAIEEVNAFLHSLATPDVIILDTGQVLADERGIVQAQYSQDLLHLNDAGYQVLNEELSHILADLENRGR